MGQHSQLQHVCTTARSFILGAFLFALLPALAACGGSDEASEREEIRQVVTDSINAAHAGDQRKTCSSYTAAYVREVVRENRGLKLERRTCEELVAAMERVLKQLTPDPRPRVSEVEVSGEKATARLQIATAFGPAASRIFLVRKDDNWRIDHDEDLRDDPKPPVR